MTMEAAQKKAQQLIDDNAVSMCPPLSGSLILNLPFSQSPC